MTRSRTTAVAALFAALLAGCFETTLNLGAAKDAIVDPAYCGQWTFPMENDGKPRNAMATIVNFDGKQYCVAWKNGDDEPALLSMFLVKVKDATFAQVTELKTELSDKHLIVRVEMKGSKLMMRQLDSKFFEGINNDAALRSRLDENLNNDAMYEGPWVAGSQAATP